MQPKLLTSKFQQPLLLTRTPTFHIYIDESISFKIIDGKTWPEKFFVAFCVFKEENLMPFAKHYFKAIYQDHYQKEIKSFNISDKKNREALSIVQKYIDSAKVFARDAFIPENNKEVINAALEIRSYIDPLEKMVSDLQAKYSFHRLNINVYIDETSQNKDGFIASYNQEKLNSIGKKLSTNDQIISIRYSTKDSRNSYGIQAADMLAGAYRKENFYLDKENLIPKDLHYQEEKINLSNDQQFLLMLGKIALKSTKNKVATCSLKSNFQNRTYEDSTPKSNFPKIHKFLFNLLAFNHRKTAKSVLNSLDSINQTQSVSEIKYYLAKFQEFNKEINAPISKYNLKIYGYIFQFSNKKTPKHFKKTIINLQKNIKLIERQTNINRKDRLKIIHAEKRLIKEIDNLL